MLVDWTSQQNFLIQSARDVCTEEGVLSTRFLSVLHALKENYSIILIVHILKLEKSAYYIWLKFNFSGNATAAGADWRLKLSVLILWPAAVVFHAVSLLYYLCVQGCTKKKTSFKNKLKLIKFHRW